MATTPREKKMATTATTVNFMVVSFFPVTWDAKLEVSSDHCMWRRMKRYISLLRVMKVGWVTWMPLRILYPQTL